ncbi:MAG TPA: hypothetical protein PLX43_03945, partial [Nitrobacter sp.]|nr:hypothetical protein [Nitrobacter sp.]
RPYWPIDIFMPLALLVINPHQHLTAFDTGPTSALHTGRFLKGVYFKMQAPFMLLCGNHERDSLTRTDWIFALYQTSRRGFFVDTSSRSHDRRPQSSYSFLTMYQVLVIGDKLEGREDLPQLSQRGFDRACHQRRILARRCGCRNCTS